MNHHHPPLEVTVWGEYACFTRPEMKAERVSYPVMTPSAARGILEAIFWKPEFYYRVREIVVLKPIRWFSAKRNEVDSRASYTGDAPYLEADERRVQRATLGLRDVAYLIRADIVLNPRADKDAAAYRDQFRRRVACGACYHHPYLGCREFAAHFRSSLESDQPISGSEANQDLGRMLLDIDFDPKDPGRVDNACPGKGLPVFFDARLEGGVMRVPQEEFKNLRWAQGGEV